MPTRQPQSRDLHVRALDPLHSHIWCCTSRLMKPKVSSDCSFCFHSSRGCYSSRYAIQFYANSCCCKNKWKLQRAAVHKRLCASDGIIYWPNVMSKLCFRIARPWAIVSSQSFEQTYARVKAILAALRDRQSAVNVNASDGTWAILSKLQESCCVTTASGGASTPFPRHSKINQKSIRTKETKNCISLTARSWLNQGEKVASKPVATTFVLERAQNSDFEPRNPLFAIYWRKMLSQSGFAPAVS